MSVKEQNGLEKKCQHKNNHWLTIQKKLMLNLISTLVDSNEVISDGDALFDSCFYRIPLVTRRLNSINQPSTNRIRIFQVYGRQLQHFQLAITTLQYTDSSFNFNHLFNQFNLITQTKSCLVTSCFTRLQVQM